MEKLINSSWNKSSDRLKGSFSAALGLHLALLLGLGFVLTPASAPETSLEVTLTQDTRQDKPEDPKYIAQANQLGIDMQTPILEPSDRVAGPLQEETQASEALLANQHWQEQSEQAIRAKFNHLQQSYKRLPNIARMTSVSTKSAPEAAYMHYFEQTIETIGNLNYPKKARDNQLSGKVQLVVVLAPSGVVKQVSISSSSGSNILDQAAVRSVQLASPFRAFPEQLRDRDEIHIIRTWRYQTDNRLTTR